MGVPGDQDSGTPGQGCRMRLGKGCKVGQPHGRRRGKGECQKTTAHCSATLWGRGRKGKVHYAVVQSGSGLGWGCHAWGPVGAGMTPVFLGSLINDRLLAACSARRRTRLLESPCGGERPSKEMSGMCPSGQVDLETNKTGWQNLEVFPTEQTSELRSASMPGSCVGRVWVPVLYGMRHWLSDLPDCMGCV